MRFGSVNPHDTYLGLPSLIGANKKRVFQRIKEWVWAKLQTWKGKLFSQAGRELLIKAVCLDMPIYTMQVFKLPKLLCSELKGVMARCWWGGSVDRRKMDQQRWSKLCSPKCEEDLGFKDLRTFNQALVVKQGWWITQYSDSLMPRLIRGKYFPSSSFFQAKIRSKPFYFWRSLLWSRPILLNGTCWQIRDGSTIRAFQYHWIPDNPSFRSITTYPKNHE